MRFGDLTYEEIRQKAAEGWLAIVPTGCSEQQGPHLPVGFDTSFVEQACLASATQQRLVVTPTASRPPSRFTCVRTR